MSREEVHAQKENQNLKDTLVFLLASLSRNFPWWRQMFRHRLMVGALVGLPRRGGQKVVDKGQKMT